MVNNLLLGPGSSKVDVLRFMFDMQLRALRAYGSPYGCYKHVVSSLFEKKKETIDMAMDMEMFNGHIPFVAVVPKNRMNIYALMELLYNSHGKRGFLGFSQDKLIHSVPVPEDPYFMFNVEDGTSTLGKTSEEAKSFFDSQARSCLTVEEVIALCYFQSDVLLKHFLDCIGSYFSSDDRIPVLCLKQRRPWIALRKDVAHEKCGVPSCHKRA